MELRKQNEKLMMAEAATLYYKQGRTQQEIAELMRLSRQTVSKLLGDALKENIVEITIHDPKVNCHELSQAICEKFSLERCVVCSVSGKNDMLRLISTVKTAAEYLLPILQQGNLKIALSWGRTVQALTEQLPEISTEGNQVFPLFGATDNEHSYFSSNELARSMADKIGAAVKYAWFPYLADSENDSQLLQKLSYFQKLQALWRNADLAIVGIGNTEILDVFGQSFGYSDRHSQIIGDIATHFFTESGELVDLYPNTLCASAENLKNCANTVAVASGSNKAAAIAGALRTGLLRTLITDEHTARQILSL